MAESLRRELRENRGHRLTVYWRCGSNISCSTGMVVEIGYDFIELAGLVPTFAEAEGECTDQLDVLLQTVIPLKSICGFVEDVPSDRKAAFSFCCAAVDPLKQS